VKRYIVEISGSIEVLADSKIEAAEKATLEITGEMMDIYEVDPKASK